MDEPTDQDIDTAGTEADPHSASARAHEDETGQPPSGAKTPGSTGAARGSDPQTLHRSEDDEVAKAHSPEFNDRPDSDRTPD